MKVVNSDKNKILFKELNKSPRGISSPRENLNVRTNNHIDLKNNTDSNSYFKSSTHFASKSEAQISNKRFIDPLSIPEDVELKKPVSESSILKNTTSSLVFKNSLVPEGSTPKKWQLITALPANAILYFCFYYRGIQILSTDYEIVPNPIIDGNRTHLNYLQVSKPDQSFDYILQSLTSV